LATTRYCFSGHESFHCKSLWLKKGYDFLAKGNAFNSPDAVVRLGVGKNMVSAIRFWMKAFGLTINDAPTELARYIFAQDNGVDTFLEDINTLWLMHYSLVKANVASIYNLLFLEFQREKKEFEKSSLQSFIKRKCSVPEQKNVYNENTVKKDINVLLQNYIMPTSLKSIEDFSALMIGLNLILQFPASNVEKSDSYYFNETKVSTISPSVILYALIDIKGDDNTVSFDKLKDLSLIFCLSVPELIEIIKSLESSYPKLHYTDNSGIKNVQFTGTIEKFGVLNDYYHNTL
jgi:hypothetical protein